MKLIQINTWSGKLAPTLMKFLEAEQPDFITAQEIFNSETDVPTPYDIFNLGPRIRDTLGLAETFLAPRYSIDVAGKERFYGNMIFSRWPMKNQEITPIFNEPIFHVQDGGLIENVAILLQTATVAAPDGDFILANYHGYVVKSPTGYLGDEIAEKCSAKVAAKLREISGGGLPIIFAGDFNISPEAVAMRAFDNDFRDLTAENHIAKTLSPAHRWNGPAACDHILVSNYLIKIKNFAVPEVLISDHLPLVMEFELK